MDAISDYLVAIKGPLTTPVGGGIRSLNVSLRQLLDLYACVRPVKWIRGVPSPVKNPEKLDIVIFRENTEDVYAGIEWIGGSEEADRIREFINSNFNKNNSRKFRYRDQTHQSFWDKTANSESGRSRHRSQPRDCHPYA